MRKYERLTDDQLLNKILQAEHDLQTAGSNYRKRDITKHLRELKKEKAIRKRYDCTKGKETKEKKDGPGKG